MSAVQNQYSLDQYSLGLDKTPANYVPLTPLSFLARTAAIYPNHVSAVYEGRVFTWAQTHARCRRFASFQAGAESFSIFDSSPLHMRSSAASWISCNPPGPEYSCDPLSIITPL